MITKAQTNNAMSKEDTNSIQNQDYNYQPTK